MNVLAELTKRAGKSVLSVYRNQVIMSLANNVPPSAAKNWLIRRMGAKIGKNVFIAKDAIIDPIFPELIEIRDDAFIGWGARLFAHIVTPYSIKAYTSLKSNPLVKFVDVIEYGCQELIVAAGRIVIKEGAFIGGFTTVRLGVIVGEKAIVASDSLVTKSVGDGEFVFGVPARS